MSELDFVVDDEFAGAMRGPDELGFPPPTVENVQAFEGYSSGYRLDRIHDYLGLPSAETLLNTAVNLVPRGRDYNPAQAARQALEIYQEIESCLNSLRTDIAVSMRAGELWDLCERLGVKSLDDTGDPAFYEQSGCPVVGPAVEVLSARQNWRINGLHELILLNMHEDSFKHYFKSFFHVSEHEEQLYLPDASKFGIAFDRLAPTPKNENSDIPDEIPQRLASDLLWVLDEKNDIQSNVINAFIGLLIYKECESSLYQDDRFLELSPTEQGGTRPWHPTIEDWKQLKEFKAGFAPRKQVPEIGYQIAKYALTYHWTEAIGSKDYAWLFKNFKPFWKEHKTAYLIDQKEYVHFVESKRRAANVKHQKRELELCLKWVRSFFSKQQNAPLPATWEERESILRSFADDETNKSYQRDMFVDLIETLHSRHNNPVEEILECLKNSALERFKALPDDDRMKRLKRMSDKNLALFKNGKIPTRLEVFKNLDVQGVEECIKLWKENTESWRS